MEDDGAERAVAEAAATEAANSPVFFIGMRWLFLLFFVEGKLRGNFWGQRRAVYIAM